MYTLLLAGCGGGGGSDVGDQPDLAPEARAQAVGSSATTRGTVTARAGSELLLTGQDSEGYDDPILDFQWRQVDDSGVPAVLVERGRNSRALAVPAVSEPVTLAFELTVTDAEGRQDSDRVDVQVLPVPDPDLFLQLEVNEPGIYQYALVVATEPGEAGGGEFVLGIDTVLRWPDRQGTRRERVLASETLNGRWPAGPRAGADPANPFLNPLIVRPIPRFEADDVNRHLEASEDRDRRLEPHEIDRSELFLRFRLESFDRNARVYARLANGDLLPLFATVNGVVDSGLVNAASLRRAPGGESAASAAKYYALIDAPPTLAAWKARAGFDPAPAGQPGVAHARYLNNYDLGFGREMYLRVDEDCGAAYAFVTNYPNLEAALQSRNRIATVAIEYSTIDGSCNGDKLIKFMAYAPDDTTGEDRLSRSMNFDGRGQHFVPGVCLVCHRGDLPDLSGLALEDIAGLSDAERFERAFMDSSFVPWDMDALLFTDDDPGLTADTSRVDRDTRERFSRSAQQDAIRALNEGLLTTYRERPERYAASIKLVHGWYGRYPADGPCPEGGDPMPPVIDQLPEQPFDSDFVQCGWRDEPELYHQVFTKYCRSCHTQGDPRGALDSAEAFLSSRGLLPLVFDQASMPLARLVYDRFWLDFDGGTSAGEQLAQRLGLPPEQRPGQPSARFEVNAADGSELESLRPGDTVLLDASTSRFPGDYQWTLDSDCGAVPPLQGGGRVVAAFVAGDEGCRYTVSLSVSNGRGTDTAEAFLTVEADP